MTERWRELTPIRCVSVYRKSGRVVINGRQGHSTMILRQPPAGPLGWCCGWRMGAEMGWGLWGMEEKVCNVLLWSDWPQAFSCLQKHVHTHIHTCMKIPIQRKRTARIITNPRRSPPSTPKHGPLTSSPTALLVNCQSHHSPWKDTRDTWLLYSAGDWLSQLLPPNHHQPPPPRLRIIHTQLALTEKNRAGTIKHMKMKS